MSQPSDQFQTNPRRYKAVLDRDDRTLRLSCRAPAWGTSIFLLLWLTLWTVGCVALVGQVVRDHKLSNVLFAVPFWASWFLVAWFLIIKLLQTEELVLGPSGLFYRRRVFIPVKERVLPLEEIKAFDAYSVASDSESGRRESGIEVITTGRPLRFLHGLSAEEVSWLVLELNDQLNGSRRASAPATKNLPLGCVFNVTDCGAGDSAGNAADLTAGSAVVGLPCDGLPCDGSQARRPSDCQWERDDEGLSFSRRGKLRLVQVFSLLFLNAFWNGIVLALALRQWGVVHSDSAARGAQWWVSFFFLIPFELIGAAFILGLIMTLLEPVHRVVWRFYQYEIEVRETWFGLGRRRTWPIDRLGRLVVREDRKIASVFVFRPAEVPDYFLRRLDFIDQGEAEVCSIKGLTEGEAQWIGQTVQGERPGWFALR